MGIIIDIIIVLFMILSVYLGYKKGLIVLGVQLIASICSIIIALILYRPVGDVIINTTQLDENIQKSIETNAQNMILEESDNEINNELIENVKEEVFAETSRNIAINIIYGITMIGLFIVSKICFIFIKSLSNIISKLPIINQFNKLGGIIYGLFRGLLITYIIVVIINIVVALNPKCQLSQMVNETYLVKAMMTYNI